MKMCRKCQIEKPLDGFYNQNNRKSTKMSNCKICVKKQANDWHKNNKERNLINVKRWTANNKEKHNRSMKKCKLKKFYNMTLEQYDNLVIFQSNKCAICDQKEKNDLSVDHNHITGEIRGLLCQMCNKALGLFKTDLGPELLEKAIKYIKKT